MLGTYGYSGLLSGNEYVKFDVRLWERPIRSRPPGESAAVGGIHEPARRTECEFPSLVQHLRRGRSRSAHIQVAREREGSVRPRRDCFAPVVAGLLGIVYPIPVDRTS